MASDQTAIVLVSKLSDNYLTLCLFDHCTSPTSLELSEDIQEKFPSRHFPCFRVGRRIALIREHFCVNWLNLEAIWRLPRRHMLRAPSHLSSGKARGDLRQSYPISKQAEHESHQLNIVHTNILAPAQGIFPFACFEDISRCILPRSTLTKFKVS